MNEAYLFNSGKNYQSYRFLGSHPINKGYRFSVYAPNALQLQVVGDFNQWQPIAMKNNQKMGIWTIEIEDAKEWDRYAYLVTDKKGQITQKSDPFARHCETRPKSASILYDYRNDFEWSDKEWLSKRNNESVSYEAPLNIYEVHLGSFKQYDDGNPFNYKNSAIELASYLIEMGYNAIEIMPITEYPLDDSWGYQVTGYFAPTSRYGTPADFKFFVDHMHKHGIRVILDWVPAHFPKDSFGLANFDGTALYEYADSRIGEHKGWGTLVFNYGKTEVISFLNSSAWFFIDEFHVDGLRVDAVSSMIYLDYDRTEFLQNQYGGNENLEALQFLRQLNEIIRTHFKGVYMIAEESTSFPFITHPVDQNGLGFTHKWNMGWMHDTLHYMSLDYIHRKYHHNQLSFSMTYAFSEHYILSFSHDEVVHGKQSIIDKMPGDLWRKFANERAMMMYMMSHPGAKLNFMGYEIGQFIEWRCKEQLEWFLLDYEHHRQFHSFIKTLNHYYLQSKAFWTQDQNWYGFEWLQVNDSDNSVYIFVRQAKYDEEVILVILNLTPAVINGYEFFANRYGKYQVMLNSDDGQYGGSDYWLDRYKTREPLIFSTIPETEQIATKKLEEEIEVLEKKRIQLEEERRCIENQKNHLLDEYKMYMNQLEILESDHERLSDVHIYRGFDTPISVLPQIELKKQRPKLTIDLPPLCGIYLKWIEK